MGGWGLAYDVSRSIAGIVPMSSLPPIARPKPSPSTGGDTSSPAPGITGPIGPPKPSHIRRLQTALGNVDSHKDTPTQARAVVSSYFRFLNPKMTTEHLPRSLHIHPINPERTTDRGVWNVFYFHLGNAAKALQEAYTQDLCLAKAAGNCRASLQKKFDAALATLEIRTSNLEGLAATGPMDWRVDGDDSTGYHLVSTKAYNAVKAKQVAQRVKDERRDRKAPIQGAEVPEEAADESR